MLKKITKWETEDGTVFDTQEEAEDYMFEQEKEVMTHTNTEQPEALRLAAVARQHKRLFIEEIANEFEDIAYELERLHARVQELEDIRKAACKAYNVWVYADDTYGEVTKAMHSIASAMASHRGIRDDVEDTSTLLPEQPSLDC